MLEERLVVFRQSGGRNHSSGCSRKIVVHFICPFFSFYPHTLQASEYVNQKMCSRPFHQIKIKGQPVHTAESQFTLHRLSIDSPETMVEMLSMLSADLSNILDGTR